MPALLINLGIVPLYVEEPRRATIALEMLIRGNWLLPTINGAPYYLKPPVFNWILASWYHLTGYPSEFITRITTIISLLVFGLIIYLAGKKYVSLSFGALSAFLFVTAAGNLFFNSLLAEIDIFYSMITYLALICMFHLQQKKKYVLLFLVVYFLGAVGTLTKGMPSILFTGLSILVYFLVNREFKRLFSWKHLAGIILYIIMVGGYFLAYNKTGDALKYILSLSIESGQRLSGDTFGDYLKHIALYPLDTLMNLLPAAILLIFTIRRSFLQVIRENAFMKFSFLMLIVHFPVYWLPPGGRQRYIIMLYPFIIQILTYFYHHFSREEKGKSRIFNIIIAISLGIASVACLVPLFVKQMDFIPNLAPVCISLFSLMVVIVVFQIIKPRYSIVFLIFSMILIRVFFDLTVLPVRAKEGGAPANKNAALEIARLAEGKPLNIYRSTFFPMQSVFYLERERNEIVPIRQEAVIGQLYIVEKYLLQDYSTRRDEEMKPVNPFHPFSDPFTWDDKDPLNGYSYQKIHEFDLQKHHYILLMPCL